jgi:hypothetical protein
MAPLHDPLQNHLLAALPGAELKRWLPVLEPVAMPLGMVLHEPGAVQSHAYFPTTAIVSLLYIIDSGASAEIAVVGLEGFVGVSLILGGDSTPSRAVVQSGGAGYRLKGRAMSDGMSRAPVRPILLRYTQALMTQELIANMLGVRREGVTQAALELQASGLIRYSRGHIVVLDREGLERRTCECYAVVKKEYERLLPAEA